MRKTKGAISMNALVALVLVFLALVIIFIFVVDLSKDIKNVGDVESCRESILLAAQTKKIANKPFFNLHCQRRDLVIKKSDVVVDGKIDQDKVGKILSEAMAECHYMTGEGKIDPFSNLEGSDNSYCLICKQIKFDDSLRNFIESNKENNPEYNEFKYGITSPLNYIDDHYVGDSDETYLEYLYGVESIAELGDQIKYAAYRPLPENSYIVISYIKGGELTSAGQVVTLGLNSYGHCEDCEGKGTVTIVTQDEFYETFYKLERSWASDVDIPLCSIVVN